MRHPQNAVRSIGALMCIALLGGCAPMTMQKVSQVGIPRQDTALVTFVRPLIFMRDSVSVDIWDGERFIGVLDAGTLIQYEAEPGEHLFLANAENRSYAITNLLPGRRYFIKANISPGVILVRVALDAVPKTDSRIEGWLSDLKPMSALPQDRQALESKKQNEIRTAVREFKAGGVTSYTELRPEDGL